MRNRNQQSEPEIEVENPIDRTKPREHEEQRQTARKTKKMYIKNGHLGPIKTRVRPGVPAE